MKISHKPVSLFLVAALLALGMSSGCASRSTPPLATLTTAPPGLTATPPPAPTPVPERKTHLVISAADSGPGTLRQALLDAQPHDAILFDAAVFPPHAPVAIALASGLPELSQGYLTIDASDAGVILDGSQIAAPGPQHGLAIPSDGNVIRGLQISGFSDAGIGLYGGAQYNLIGGERSVGAGPLGQGNLLSGNGNFGVGLWDEGTSFNAIQGNFIGVTLDGAAAWGHKRDGIHSNGATQNLITGNVIAGNEMAGVYLCCALDGRNTVSGNLIGVGPRGNPIGNGLAGVVLDRSGSNVVGPGNTIAYNLIHGVSFWEGAANNIVTQNSIRDNGERGISAAEGQSALQPPLIVHFDLQGGFLSGVACPGCTVEIFSDQDDQGAVYESQAVADAAGNFTLDQGAAFLGPHLTGTATGEAGNTSPFSLSTRGSGIETTLQTGNDRPVSRLEALCSMDLAYNQIGAVWGHVRSLEGWGDACAPQGVRGFKMVRLAFNEVEDWPSIDWSRAEFDIPPEMDAFVAALAESGMTITYELNFWDKANHPQGWPEIPSRFTTEEEIQRYLEYVRFIVSRFKGRVAYYELWNEPDNQGSAIQHIRPQDYIELARRAVPVIREADPEAKIVVGSVSNLRGSYAQEWLFRILRSDIMPLVDGIAWHPMYGPSPDYADESGYYYAYPGILRSIQETAGAHGFQGEFRGDEIGWCSPDYPSDCGAIVHSHSNIAAAKYHARGIVIHLGLGAATHLASVSASRRETNAVISGLATILAGARAEAFPVQIQAGEAKVASYTFVLPNGERLLAIWTDGVALDEDPGVSATLTFPGASAARAVASDPLHGFEQELIAQIENGDLAIHQFLIKDYPLFIRLDP